MLLPNHTEQSITFYQTGMGWHERGSNTYSGNMIPLQLPLNTPGHARCEGVDVDLFLVFLVFNLFPIRVHFVDTRPANIGCGMPALSALTSFAPAFREHETVFRKEFETAQMGFNIFLVPVHPILILSVQVGTPDPPTPSSTSQSRLTSTALATNPIIMQSAAAVLAEALLAILVFEPMSTNVPCHHARTY
jgi:hypothetical protein